MRAFLFLFLLLALACTHSSPQAQISTLPTCLPLEAISLKSDLNLESTKWVIPQGQPQGVALLLHGLNMRPSKMGALGELLGRQKISVLQVALSGHIPRQTQDEEWQNLSPDLWAKEAYEAYCLALQTAEQKNLPLYLVGYSLGGALISHILLNSRGPLYAKTRAILLAPAIALPWYASLIKLSRVLGPTALIPSFNIEAYQAFRGTSVAGYNALFALVDNFEAAKEEELKKLSLPTLVIMDPQDELVSFKGVERLMKEKHLSQWRLIKVDNKSSELAGKYHHLIVDQASLGPEGWQTLEKAVLGHIQGPAPLAGPAQQGR